MHNKSVSANRAMRLLFHILHPRRPVAEPDRCASAGMLRLSAGRYALIAKKAPSQPITKDGMS